MRKNRAMLLSAILILLALSSRAWGDVKLPPPRMDNGTALFDALKRRASAPGGDFPTVPLSDEDLSDVLWAATGLNRGEKGWTVPMAEGYPPYIDIYAATDGGVFLYDWNGHFLREISKDDIRANIGLQRFVVSAPCSLILVANAKSLAPFRDDDIKKEFAHVAAGAMTQNIYLAAAAIDAGARYIHSMKTDAIKSALRLSENDFVICLMMLGR